MSIEEIEAWRYSIIVFLSIFVIAISYDSFLYRILYVVADYTPTKYDDYILAAFKYPLYYLLWMLALYWGTKLSPHDVSGWHGIMLAVLRSSIIICISCGFYILFSKSNGFLEEAFSYLGEGFKDIAVNISSPLFRFMVAILAIVLVGREFNYDVSVFFASLSLGSVAVAFAAKDVLANLFGSAVVLMDKPFVVGDWVIINGVEGIVETISFRSTSIRKFSQQLVYIPNAIISNSPVINYSRMQKRRIDFKFHLSYLEKSDKLEEFLKEVKAWLESREYSMGEASVNFVEYQDYYMAVRVIMYVNVYEFYAWLKLLDEVNFGIKKLAEKHHVSIAVPTRINIPGENINEH